MKNFWHTITELLLNCWPCVPEKILVQQMPKFGLIRCVNFQSELAFYQPKGKTQQYDSIWSEFNLLFLLLILLYLSAVIHLRALLACCMFALFHLHIYMLFCFLQLCKKKF